MPDTGFFLTTEQLAKRILLTLPEKEANLCYEHALKRTAHLWPAGGSLDWK